jgi:dephospho-CoA kinase
MTYIVSIRGVPGSGKSFICSQLKNKNVECIDTDDVLTEAYDIMIGSNIVKSNLHKCNKKSPDTIVWHRAIANPILKKGTELLNKKIKESNAALIIVVGIMLSCKADRVFFVTMDEATLKKAYRRTMKRELSKITKNKNTLLKLIDKSPIDRIGLDLTFQYHINALEIGTTFPNYKEVYKHALKHEKKSKATCASQSQIIRQIKSMLQRPKKRKLHVENKIK